MKKTKDSVRTDMMQRKARIRHLVLLGAITGAIFFATGIHAYVDTANSGSPERSDVINIDAMTAFGPLERQPVEFLHDTHAQAVEKAGKNCIACHPQDEASGRLSLKYMRFTDTDKQLVMDTYHAGCIECHNEALSAGKASGPIVCAGCHDKEAKTVSNRQPFGMDNSLHFRHIKSAHKGCGTCHHEYDASEKKLVHKAGNEGTCRYCHLDQAEENRIAMKDASHIACVGCHRSLSAQNEAAGPTECAGCHDAGRQASIEKLTEVPRMKRKQSDAAFVKTGDTETLRMNPVPFDHKAHETYNDTCRACHHASLTACADCHTMTGKEEGAWVNLEQAMHGSGSGAGCVGCHEQKQTESACAGCHGFMTKTRQMSRAYCSTCHLELPAEVATAAVSAAEALAARTPAIDTYDEASIPEVVTIKSLSETYEPVKLTHGMIVSTLIKGVENNNLATYFHTEQGTLCQGCHHNSPATQKPPQCASCHGKPFQESDLGRPGLMAAYHQQCMGCHDQMGIEQPASRNCAGCHKEK